MKLELETLTDHTINWDWENSHVTQSFIDTGTGDVPDTISINDIVEAGTVLIAAGPADLEKAAPNATTAGSGFRIVPIGLVETAQISMNKPLSRIFEIGSKLSYIIPGRTIGGISISRVFFDGPSLLKAIYMGEVKADYADKTVNIKEGQGKLAAFESTADKTYQAFDHIGSGNLAMNLASSFFDQPCGLAFLFRDQQNQSVGQIYFEGCRVSTYNIGISAQMNVLTEAISMEFVRCRPIVTAASNEYDRTDPTKDLADINIVSARANTAEVGDVAEGNR